MLQCASSFVTIECEGYTTMILVDDVQILTVYLLSFFRQNRLVTKLEKIQNSGLEIRETMW